MTPVQAITALFDDDGAAVLAQAHWTSGWEALVARLSPAAVKASMASRLPGFALLQRLRALGESDPALGRRLAPALTRGIIGWLADKVGPDHPETLVELGALGRLARKEAVASGDEAAWRSAASLLQESWEGLRALGRDDARTAGVGASLADVWTHLGRDAEASDVRAWCLAVMEPAGGPAFARLCGDEARALEVAGEHDAALLMWTRGWERLGAGDLAETATVGPGLAAAMTRSGDLVHAASVWRTVHERVGDGLPGEATRRARRVQALEAAGMLDEAWRVHRPLLESERGATSPSWRVFQQGARLAELRGDAEAAEGLLREALTVCASADGPEGFVPQAELGAYLARHGDAAEAAGWLEVALSGARAANSDRLPDVASWLAGALMAVSNRAAAHGSMGDAKAAAAHALDLVGDLLAHDHPSLAAARARVAS